MHVFVHTTHLIFSKSNVDYEEDDANKGDCTNKDKLCKQVIWTSFKTLESIISLTSMKTAFFFKIDPKNISRFGTPWASIHYFDHS